MDQRWIPAFSLAELPVGRARVFKHERDQVAVFRIDETALHAVDNRCPHEGYPLSQGYVKEGLLTCCWHNYKFRLADGACVVGEEAVRVYPVRVRDGRVELDLTPQPAASVVPRLLESLERGLRDREIGRVARDVVRLLDHGVAPERIAAEGAVFDALYAEWGSSHALPVAADILGWLPRFPGVQAALPLVQALDVAAEAHVRRPLRERAAPVDPGEDPAQAGVRLRQLVEDEQADAAEALMRGAAARGWERSVVEPWLLQICADHFLDFGHALIYTVKGLALLDRVGYERADPILSSLVYGITYGTREDLLPEWKVYRDRMAALDLAALDRAAPDLGATPALLDALEAAVLDGTGSDALGAVEEALRGGASAEGIADRLALCGAERLLRFDTAIVQREDVQDDWLDVTHRHTFANAVRHAVGRLPGPERLRFLFQAARFVNLAKGLDLPPSARPSLDPLPGGVERLLRAIGAQAADEAVGVAAGCLADGVDLRPALQDAAVHDPAVRAVVVAHVIKTLAAAFDDTDRTGDVRPVLGAVRLMASPLRERRVVRRVREAIELVVHGRVPKTLA